ncbi:type II secretion system F family protein [Desulfotomaculum nigrificans]|uniref:type II secretion system F family protein n=1 Tax=Desulfotomaculum nigrificans TaxID=1565 RepID=UPI0001FAE592|nr:hypothetical protein [Desulfotomaculum nigrificans]
MLTKLGLFVSIFLLFYFAFVGTPDKQTTKNWLEKYLYPAGCAAIFFTLGSWAFMTVLSGLILAVLGWKLPGYIINLVREERIRQVREKAKDFVMAASGLYSTGQSDTEVISTMSKRLPEPLASELHEMVVQRHMNDQVSYPSMLRRLGEKYNVPEFAAASAIIEAGDIVGGPVAKANGLMKLGAAIRMRSKLLLERKKANLEPKIASMFVILVLGLGLMLDITIWRDLYQQSGKFLLAIGLAFEIALIFIAIKLSSNKDL